MLIGTEWQLTRGTSQSLRWRFRESGCQMKDGGFSSTRELDGAIGTEVQ